jgi:hypothetical protein
MLATTIWLRRAVVLSAALACALAATTVSAQPANDPRAEDEGPTLSSRMSIVTLGGSFNYEHRESGQSAQMNWTLGYTYLVTDNLGLSAGISTHTEWEDYTDTTTWGELEANPILYLGHGRLRPYLGGRVGVGFGRDDNPVSFGGGAGFIYLLGSRTRGAGVGAEVGYLLARVDGESRHNVVVAVGVNFYFK